MEAALKQGHNIIVAGIGPGHPDYMAPAARHAIREAKVLVGGRRALAQFAADGQETLPITRDMGAVMAFIRERLGAQDVVVMASGDPGYYSILDALRREFPASSLRVIPGISSMQLAFSRLALPWHGARLLSMHGRQPGAGELCYRQGDVLGILTDAANNSRTVAQQLLVQGWPGEAQLFLCERLSYEDERITAMALREAAKRPPVGHGILIVRDAANCAEPSKNP